MNLTNEQQEELQRLKRNIPEFDVVYAELEQFQTGESFIVDNIWEYYYPICLHKAWQFFSDPEEGHNAAFDLMEHWLGVIKTYDETKAKLSPFFDEVSKNFFINRQKHVALGPNLVYGGTPYDDIGEDQESEEFSPAKNTEPEQMGPDYPYGVLQDSPLDIISMQEQALTIRENLFPADAEVFDLLIEGFTSTKIEEMLGRTINAVALSITRIRSLCE